MSSPEHGGTVLGRSSCSSLVIGSALFLASGLALPPAALADDEKLSAGRPGEAETTDIVPAGRIQIETGFIFERDKEGGETTKTSMFPSTLVRVGVFERLELNFSSDALVFQSIQSTSGRHADTGTGDPAVGLRYRFSDGGGLLPSAALIVAASLPIAEEPFGNGRSEFTVAVAASHSLPRELSFDWTLRYTGPTEEQGETGWELGYAASVGIGLAERLGAFVEVFGGVPSSVQADGSSSLGWGLVYYVGSGASVDLSVSRGLTGTAGDLSLGVGLAVRL